MFKKSFKQFFQEETGSALNSDGSDPNPTQTVKHAQKAASNLMSDPGKSDDVARVTSMSPGKNRRDSIFDLAAQSVQDSPNVPVTPLQVGKFLTTQFNKIGPPNGSNAGKFMKKMRKGMKK